MQTSNVAIRIAKAQDGKPLIELRNLFYQSQIECGLLDIPIDLRAYLEKTTMSSIGAKRQMFLVATENANMVGYSHCIVKHAIGFKNSIIGSIEELYVCKNRRGNDVGRLLFEKSKAVLMEFQIERLQLRVLANNGAAERFWVKMGFIQNLISMEYPICKR